MTNLNERTALLTEENTIETNEMETTLNVVSEHTKDDTISPEEIPALIEVIWTDADVENIFNITGKSEFRDFLVDNGFIPLIAENIKELGDKILKHAAQIFIKSMLIPNNDKRLDRNSIISYIESMKKAQGEVDNSSKNYGKYDK